MANSESLSVYAPNLPVMSLHNFWYFLLQIIEEDIENYASVIKGLHDEVDELGDEDKTSPEVVDRCRK